MSETAELLRVGTTLLVLDAIEGGGLARPPVLRRPIRALRAICRDPALQVAVPLAGGERWTALELQRFYLDACRQYVARHPHPPHEACEVLQRWAETLEALEQAPENLVGVLDWVTKRYLLDTAGRHGTWAERKKIDIRYHELSADGYYQVFSRTGMTATLVSEEELQRAMRTAPAGTPAALRARYIREFADGDIPLTVNWKRVEVGRGRTAKVIHLDRVAVPRESSKNSS